MLINITTLRERIHGVILNKGEQGHKIEGLENKLASINDRYDALIEFSESLYDLPKEMIGLMSNQIRLKKFGQSQIQLAIWVQLRPLILRKVVIK